MIKKYIYIILIFLCSLPAIISIVLYTFYINALAIDGKKLKDVTEEINYYERENSILNMEMSMLGTTSLISKKATELGMKSAQVSFYNKDSFAFSER